MSAKRVIHQPRSEYIKVHTDAETKARLQQIADERNWTLSLLCYEALRAWLEEKSLAWAEQVGDEHA